MFHGQGFSKSCTLLAVLCGKFVDGQPQQAKNQLSYPFPKLTSSGRLEVHTLKNPSVDKFVEVQKSLSPNFLFIQGEQLENEEEIGSLVWLGADLSDPSSLSSLISTQLPTIVYLEFPNAQKVADALLAKGVAYVIYWRNGFSSYAASHFRQAFMSVVQSSCSHTWDAFQLAHASYRLYCTRNNNAVKSQKNESKLGPCLLGEPPKINITLPEKVPIEEEGSPSNSLPVIKIYDDEINMKFLVCGAPCTLDSSILGSLEDGLNALLNIEIRGSKLHNRVSAVPPPLQAGNFSRGVITMRCDLTTCSSAHISLLVSGSAQTCFDDQLLENHIKNEIIENCHLVHAWPTSEQSSQCSSEPRKSSSIACGSPVFEVCMRVPTWASQVLKQLAPETSYHSLVSLGVASAQGTSVASFEEEDARRLLFFCTRQDLNGQEGIRLPVWLKPALPKKRAMPDHEVKYKTSGVLDGKAKIESRNTSPQSSSRKKVKIAAMKPVPHVRQHKMLPFSAVHNVGIPEGSHLKPHMPAPPPPRPLPPAPTAHKKTSSNSFHAQQIISLNPLPLKKHGCNRSPIQVCSEEEFLRDVMEFLILRGHSRLVPQGGLSEFPDAILNAKRLDLYNLYREVVTRGGFHVGNGINWKGQVFSKMRNHTVTNRMTGVGNTLKRHYETYLLEYELAHDDVDGEYCLLCHSSAPGDWVNCGLCGEWAHFGCDRRQGLGAFKDYAKTDGLEYVCPHCSVTNYRRKSSNVANGFAQGSAAPLLRHM